MIKRRSRTQRPQVDPRQLTAHDIRILVALERYRYLDTPHIKLLTNWHNRNAHYGLERLFGMKLINVLPSNQFGRDRLGSPLIYEITKDGSDQLGERGIKVFKATWLHAGTYKNPVHNLNLCLSLCCIELAHQKAALRFIPWGEILEAAPKETQDAKNPHVIVPHTVPDAIYGTEYPEEFTLTFFELDLSNHGEKEYREKFKHNERIILEGLYKTHFKMKQHAYVNTLTSSPARKDHMAVLPSRKSLFRFKVEPRYGSYQGAPAPNLDILAGWQVQSRTINLSQEV